MPDSASRILTVRSRLALASLRPSGLNVSWLNATAGCFVENTVLLTLRSQTVTCPGGQASPGEYLTPAARRFPFGPKTTLTGVPDEGRDWSTLPVNGCQIRS